MRAILTVNKHRIQKTCVHAPSIHIYSLRTALIYYTLHVIERTVRYSIMTRSIAYLITCKQTCDIKPARGYIATIVYILRHQSISTSNWLTDCCWTFATEHWILCRITFVLYLVSWYTDHCTSLCSINNVDTMDISGDFRRTSNLLTMLWPSYRRPSDRWARGCRQECMGGWWRDVLCFGELGWPCTRCLQFNTVCIQTYKVMHEAPVSTTVRAGNDW